MFPVFYVAIISSALCGVYIGYDLGVISGVLTMPASIEHFQWKNDSQKGFVASSFILGAFFSSMFSGLFADRFGRRNTIIGASAVFLIGGILQIAANGLAMLYIGRIVAGLAVGITYAVVPLYHSEISPRKLRGSVVYLKNVGLAIGLLAAYTINYASSHLKGKASFRVTLTFQVLPAFIVIAGMLLSPYSPRWLLYKNNRVAASKSLAQLRNLSEDAPEITEELDQIVEMNKEQTSNKLTWTSLVKSGMHKHLILGMLISISQQLSGINNFTYYTPDILRLAGFKDKQEQLLLNIGNGVVALSFSALGGYLIDRVGRRVFFIVGGITMGMTALTLAVLLATGVSEISHTKGYGILAVSYAFMGTYSATLGPVVWVYISEIYPQHIRAKAVALATACNWITNFTVTQLAPHLISTIGWGTFAMYSGFCFIGATWQYFILPETKHKTLEEIGGMFLRKPDPLPK